MNAFRGFVWRGAPILRLFLVPIVCFTCWNAESHGQSQTVTDYDGNVYTNVRIGSQLWMKESLKSLHYSDGTAIQGVLAYNNNEAFVQTYGRLYTWYAAMKNSTTPGTQGGCPNGWHVPTDAEWTSLTNALGGESVAGGHLKESGTTHWRPPNTGADNSSGFTALPSGMYFENAFHYLQYNVEFWTSSHSFGPYAFYRILYHNTGDVVRSNWFDKSSYRSVRCLCNVTAGAEQDEHEPPLAESFVLYQNYPNPFNPSTTIWFALARPSRIVLSLHDVLGRTVRTLVDDRRTAGSYSVLWDGTGSDGTPLPSGMYFIRLTNGGYMQTKNALLIK